MPRLPPVTRAVFPETSNRFGTAGSYGAGRAEPALGVPEVSLKVKGAAADVDAGSCFEREASALVPEPRLHRSCHDVARELRTQFREMDASTLGPRIAAIVYLATGLLALGAVAVSPNLAATGVVPIAVTAAIFGAGALVLPWHRWPVPAQLVLAVFAFVLFGWGGVLANEPAGPYLAALPLPFVFVGLTQRPGTSLLLAPVALGSLVVAARFTLDGSLAATLLFALPMSLLVGETIAQAELHRTRAEHRVERLLHAVRVLARVDGERLGAQLVASLAAELLGAQAASVLLADRPGSRRYLNRAYFGHPALADVAPLILDGWRAGEQRAAATQFLTARALRRPVRAAAIVPLPGPGPVPVGVVVAMWGAPRRRLNAAARQSAELLSEEAGRMFCRLREAAALVHDAQTDPLTELANRRTFARALEVLRPGDAVVIVDLDHFKAVNDRYGHDQGDRTLRALARCLRGTARQVDCVARYGGEEFALVLPGAGAPGARVLLGRVRAAWAAQDPLTTFSAGVAVHAVGESPRATMQRADTALYAAKEAGRDRDVVAAAAEVVLP
jgi:diguanylate cyclase (GGDEF)-like protein